MSYSFGVRAASKAEAKEQLVAKFDEVVATQPTHAADRQQAQAAAFAFVDALTEDAGKDVVVSVNGWVSWMGTLEAPEVVGAAVTVSANLIARDAG